ncbi:hypothetical protein DPMN_031467 [Dreissena polymorpha]|uniref:Uncharacterized protein n=1 Tax=Dreissena polymorpha TaxID=45954 RepID=A0A9D4M287_DREPO|nr:hypothetical protein DPMN_031467 [Dreissena polymorpha]
MAPDTKVPDDGKTDGRKDGRKDGQRQNNIPPPMAGDNYSPQTHGYQDNKLQPSELMFKDLRTKHKTLSN